MCGEGEDILAPLPEGRRPELNHVEPMKKVDMEWLKETVQAFEAHGFGNHPERRCLANLWIF
jgi:hypothetical protein